ncbi:hypothetical protein ACFL0Y_03755, partial [Patescibacteria group bacterium]
IAGDFNADFRSTVIKDWLKMTGLKPIFSQGYCTVCPTKNPLCHRDQEKDFQIDNVLVKGFKKLSGKLVFNRKGEYLSDHFGQLVEIEV